jgi:hypothetical protein
MRTGTTPLARVLAKGATAEYLNSCRSGNRTWDVVYKDRGTEVASVTVFYKRGKETGRSILVNEAYL